MVFSLAWKKPFQTQANGVIREGNLRRILFAPVFSRLDHQHFASHGFQAKDIHGMARTFGLDPVPSS